MGTQKVAKYVLWSAILVATHDWVWVICHPALLNMILHSSQSSLILTSHRPFPYQRRPSDFSPDFDFPPGVAAAAAGAPAGACAACAGDAGAGAGGGVGAGGTGAAKGGVAGAAAGGAAAGGAAAAGAAAAGAVARVSLVAASAWISGFSDPKFTL